jgi:hypothetical protein
MKEELGLSSQIFQDVLHNAARSTFFRPTISGYIRALLAGSPSCPLQKTWM